jgi:hypothetical protein
MVTTRIWRAILLYCSDHCMPHVQVVQQLFE